MSSTGTIIIVTGTTGSGKTTTCREFIASAKDLWLHFGVDNLLGILTPRQFVDGGPRASEGVHMVPLDPRDPEGGVRLALGRYGMPMIEAFHDMLAAGTRAGRSFIVDHIATTNPPLLQDCVKRLRGLPVLFVALRPPMGILAERIDARLPEVEKILGPQLARTNNENTKRASRSVEQEIFSHDFFDLVLDSGAMTPSQVAAAIVARSAQGPGEAFDLLAQHFGVVG